MSVILKLLPERFVYVWALTNSKESLEGCPLERKVNVVYPRYCVSSRPGKFTVVGIEYDHAVIVNVYLRCPAPEVVLSSKNLNFSSKMANWIIVSFS